jgi:solute carrier family 8 (sodium/calcium exchanger)
MIQTKVWNPTVANLTLMALGSSAPEILLSVIETVGALGGEPGELGPSTIVGSAAFNLMVISGVSITAVTDGVKNIENMYVFAITATFSLWAYIWLLIVLVIWTPDYVSVAESVLTLVFFFLLIIFSFMADRFYTKTMLANRTKD